MGKIIGKLVHVVGVNDADFKISIGGKYIESYRKWSDMLMRCYSPKHQAKHPAYIGVTVCDEWLKFNNFNSWYLRQYPHVGMDIDKDILFAGNKVYSPKTCVLIPRKLNQLLTSSGASRGEFPLGVCLNKSANKYQAKVNVNGKRKYLGYHDTPMEAHYQWQKAKEALIRAAAAIQQDKRIAGSLIKRANEILLARFEYRETVAI